MSDQQEKQEQQELEEQEMNHETTTPTTGSTGSTGATGTPAKKAEKAQKRAAAAALAASDPNYKRVVQRIFHKSHSTNNGLRKRATIFYEYDRDNKVLKYGAVVVTMTQEMKKKDPKEFEEAAKKRFSRDPVIVRNFADNGSLTDFQESVRSMLFKFGCKGTKVTDSTKKMEVTK